MCSLRIGCYSPDGSSIGIDGELGSQVVQVELDYFSSQASTEQSFPDPAECFNAPLFFPWNDLMEEKTVTTSNQIHWHKASMLSICFKEVSGFPTGCPLLCSTFNQTDFTIFILFRLTYQSVKMQCITTITALPFPEIGCQRNWRFPLNRRVWQQLSALSAGWKPWP